MVVQGHEEEQITALSEVLERQNRTEATVRHKTKRRWYNSRVLYDLDAYLVRPTTKMDKLGQSRLFPFCAKDFRKGCYKTVALIV